MLVLLQNKKLNYDDNDTVLQRMAFCTPFLTSTRFLRIVSIFELVLSKRTSCIALVLKGRNRYDFASGIWALVQAAIKRWPLILYCVPIRPQ